MVARDRGIWLVGRAPPGPFAVTHLSPVYELHVQALAVMNPETGRPGIQVVYEAQPLLFAASMASGWKLESSAPVFPVDQMSVAKQIHHAIAQVEAQLQRMRAASVGLVIAGPGAMPRT